ncbi:hypothetical protein I3842_14G060100 [Carya illinoinensis]|uniref:Transmembrane protein n=1 Tax=Carya illinoinensis TaxID=32201 RepID=A0A922DCS5_CARIL|nr:hypothetical protein I3842_14G060100 [Carya illinoinensis]
MTKWKDSASLSLLPPPALPRETFHFSRSSLSLTPFLHLLFLCLWPFLSLSLFLILSPSPYRRPQAPMKRTTTAVCGFFISLFVGCKCGCWMCSSESVFFLGTVCESVGCKIFFFCLVTARVFCEEFISFLSVGSKS